ncbi:hypothetical protein H072_457 [Dactylellina haptotyla CBS 200.50]|uniref:CHAT domain-containing protein n=1 Tax=Dactylellina haptotyla (strain CBS 200.50) TaxID=1284197 RepID=S8CD17_DACHA|nr:hypothetical protein H072_457 [Dactylellina haptotyla CBS 200.50]
MDQIPFQISPEHAELVKDISNEELPQFAKDREGLTGDSDVEFHIYLCFLVYQRLGSVEHLALAISRAQGWVGATQQDVPRRLKVHLRLGLHMWHNSRRELAMVPVGFAFVERLSVILPTVPAISVGGNNLETIDLEVQLDTEISAKQDNLNATNAENEDSLALSSDLSILLWRKWEQDQNIIYLESAIKLAEVVMKGTPQDSPERRLRLYHLGFLLAQKYYSMEDIDSLENALRISDEFAKTSAPYDPRQPFLLTDAVDDIPCAISSAKKWLETLPVDDTSNRGTILSTLGILITKQFEITKEFRYLTEATKYTNLALEAIPSDRPYRSTFEYNLEMLIGLSSLTLGGNTAEDLNGSIEVADIRVETCPITKHNPLTALQMLGDLLRQRFGQTGNSSDIERIIGVTLKILEYPQLGPPQRLNTLKWLERFLEKNLRLTEGILDINRGIKASRDILNLTKPEDMDWAHWAKRVGVWLTRRFEQLGKMEDSDAAIKMLKRALKALRSQVRDGDKEKATILWELGIAWKHRYAWTKDRDDLENALDTAERGLRIGGLTHPSRGSMLLSISDILVDKFKATTKRDYLDRAIERTSEAMAACENNNDKATVLHRLSNILQIRFVADGDSEDLDQSITAAEDTLKLAPDASRPRRQEHMLYLGTSLQWRHGRSGMATDLDRAIVALQTAADLHPLGRQPSLYHLGGAFHSLYHRTQNIRDLEKAIDVTNQAIECPSLGRSMDNLFRALGNYLSHRYEVTDDPKDLDGILENYQKALEANVVDETERCKIFALIGGTFRMRYKLTLLKEDLEQAEVNMRNAWNCSKADPRSRLSAGWSLTRLLAAQQRWQDANIMVQQVVKLLSALSPRSMRSTDKQEKLIGFSNIGSAAAAIALSAGSSPGEALTILEQGRGIVSGLMLEMRTDVSELENKHPKLAEKLVALREELDEPVSEFSSLETELARELRRKKRREANTRFEKLLKEIRKETEFGSFLLPPAVENLTAAANPHPIVVINVSHYRCDAFLVERNRPIRMKELPNLRIQDITQKSKILKERGESEAFSVLEWMWEVIANPILEELGFKDTPGDNDPWPRIWWIPTGPLIQLPVHAAGKHLKPSNETVLDRVISSYSLSIKTLLYSRQRGHNRQAQAKNKALLISMPKTEGQQSLRFVDKEIGEVQIMCDKLGLEPNTAASPKNRDDILSKLDTCKIFHFAGHGLSNLREPSQSCLLLDDWKSSPLTVEALWKRKLQINPPFLAYLSACSTGSNRHTYLLDEGIHLISACQLAGFQHVIGTLWEVNDACCVSIARSFYKKICKNGTLEEDDRIDETVAVALHHAIRKLRRESINSRRAAKTRQYLQVEAPEGVGELAEVLENTDISSSDDVWSDADDTSASLSSVETSERNECCAARGIEEATFFNLTSDRTLPKKSPETEKVSESDLLADRDLVRVRPRRPPNLYWVPYIHFGV